MRALLFLSLCGCSVSLGAVQQTAALGQALSAHEQAFALAPELCAAAGDDPACALLAKDADNWVQINRALVAYARALAAMANDQDKSVADDLLGALGAAGKLSQWSGFLNANLTSGASQGTDKLLHAIAAAWRRARLQSTIRESDEAVQQIAAAVAGNIDALDRADDNLLQVDAETERALRDEPVIRKSALRAALRFASLAVEQDQRGLRAYRKAVSAFARAHGDLARHDDLADPKLLEEVIADVLPILAGAAKAAVPQGAK